MEDTCEPRSKHEEGPGSPLKKARGGKVLTREERVTVLKTQKVLNGRVFDPVILEKPCMRSLVNCVDLQEWTCLFEWPASFLHESKVREFYYKMLLNEDGSVGT